MGELGDRKHEDEVEKELHRGDLMVALALAAQQSLGVQSLDHGFLTIPRPVVGSIGFQSTCNPIIYPRTQRDFDVRL